MSASATTPQTPANLVVLEGTLIAGPEFRYTPAGRLLASLEVEHVSLESGTNQPQRLELRMPILAMGTLAEQCRLFSPGVLLRVEGSLNQKRWVRDEKVRWGRIELLAQHIKPLDRMLGAYPSADPEKTKDVDPVVCNGQEG